MRRLTSPLVLASRDQGRVQAHARPHRRPAQGQRRLEDDDRGAHAAGLGASKPVASNDTAVGRSQDRRVELVRG